jgi:hypothetical protein
MQLLPAPLGPVTMTGRVWNINPNTIATYELLIIFSSVSTAVGSYDCANI